MKAWKLLVMGGLGVAACREFTETLPNPGSAGAQAGGTGQRGATEGGAPSPEVVSRPTPGVESGGQGGAGGAAEVAEQAAGGDGGATDALYASNGHEGGEAGQGEPVSYPPFCETGVNGHPIIGLTASEDIAAARTYSGTPFVLFVSQPLDRVVALSWSIGTAWSPWACFDSVPVPKRVAAGNGEDGFLQVYAIDAAGELFVRQEVDTGYLPWHRLPPPVGSKTVLSDVSVVESTIRAVYVAANGLGVAARARADDESQSDPLPWQTAVQADAMRLAVGTLETGQHELVVIQRDGSMLSAVQVEPGTDYTFGALQSIAADHQFIDVDFARNAVGDLQNFAVLRNGALMVRTRTNHAWGPWLPVSATSAPRLSTIAAGSLSGQPPFLFGIGDFGLPYFSTNSGVTWSPRL